MGANISPTEMQTILDGLRHIVRVLRVSARTAERQHNLSAAQLFVLHQLAEADGLSINELAARTFTHQSSVSVVVRRLKAAGLVRCSDGAADARRTEVLLTASGRRRLQRTPEPAQRALIAALQRLQSSERQALASGLAALVGALGMEGKAPPLFFEEESRAARRAPR